MLKGKVERRIIAVLVGIPAFVGALAIALVDTPVSGVSPLPMTIMLGLVLVSIPSVVLWLRARMGAPNPLLRILSSLSFAITVFAFVFVSLWFVAVLDSFRWGFNVDEMPIFYLLALTVSAFSSLLKCGIWARFGNQEYRHILQGALAKLGGAAIPPFLICWWGYAVVQFGSLPLRSKFHHTIDNLIAHGELALFRRETMGTQMK